MTFSSKLEATTRQVHGGEKMPRLNQHNARRKSKLIDVDLHVHFTPVTDNCGQGLFTTSTTSLTLTSGQVWFSIISQSDIRLLSMQACRPTVYESTYGFHWSFGTYEMLSKRCIIDGRRGPFLFWFIAKEISARLGHNEVELHSVSHS